MKKRKSETAFDKLMSRQDYLVVQANDLAKAFGNLKAFDHKLLDYCFSYVTKENNATDVFKANTKEILKHFGINASGRSYEQVARGFKTLNENTALYLPIVENGVKGILMTQLFRRIKFLANGEVEFQFSEDAAPYVFALRTQYYSFKLSEIARIKSKYALILMKLWEAHRFNGSKVTTIKGNVDEWQDWFLGADKRWEPARFRQKVLEVGGVELEEKIGVDIYLDTIKNGRKVVGYEMQIIDNRKLGLVDFYRAVDRAERGEIDPSEIPHSSEYQTTIDDFL